MLSPPNTSDKSGEAFEMRSYGHETVTLRPNGKTVEAALVEEHEAKHKGATTNDQHDMDRLGKRQELRVKHTSPLSSYALFGTTDHGDDIEELSLPFDLWLLLAPGKWMGDHNYWTSGSTFERRYCWCDLVILRSHRRLNFLDVVNGRNG
jgi:hypothetical protein